jgi:hypothetical protein
MRVTTIEKTAGESEVSSQERIDEIFAEMVVRMNDLYALERQLDTQDRTGPFSYPDRIAELEAIRDGILGELLERSPHEAIAEVVQSLALVYEQRIVQSERDGSTVFSFATRQSSQNAQLDSIVDMVVHDDNSTDILAEYARDGGYGYKVHVYGDMVRTYTAVPGYPTIPTNPHEVTPDGSPNAHQRILREFYLHTLSTAGVAINRRQTQPEIADQADTSARAMLETLR